MGRKEIEQGLRALFQFTSLINRRILYAVANGNKIGVRNIESTITMKG